MDDFALIIWLAICSIPSIVLWLSMMIIMNNKGISVNFFIVRPKDYFKFWELIKHEKIKPKKIKYSLILWIQIALMLIYLAGMPILIKLIEF